MRKWGCWKRFDLQFLDNILILIWFFILGLLAVGLVFTLAPSIQSFVHGSITPEVAFMATSYVFLILSTVRYIQHWDHTPLLFPIAYLLCQVIISVMVSMTIIKKPANPVLGVILPACVAALLMIPVIRVWALIKPLETGKRRALPPRTRVRKLQKENDLSASSSSGDQ